MSYARDEARNYVNKFVAGGAAFAGVAPIPGMTSIALTGAEAKMIHGIASIYGLKTEGFVWGIILKALMLGLGGSALLKGVAEGLNFIPVIGWLAKPAVAGAAIKGIGEGTIAYFENKFPNSIAYEKPSVLNLITAFGQDILKKDLEDYYNSY